MRTPLPDYLTKGLRDIAALPQATYENFLDFLRSIPVEIKQPRVFNVENLAVTAIPGNIEPIKEAAFSLVMSRAGSRISIAAFVDRLIEGISPSPDLNDTELQTLRQRATDILSIETLDLIARAHNVLIEHLGTFTAARIVSDVRPVFGDDVSIGPLGAVFVHMLSIAHRSAGRRENFVVALDESDVDQLIEVLQRAKSKATTMRSALANSSIPYIKVG